MADNKKTSLFENGLIWFGAGVSIAEIITGTYLAPLGLAKGVLAILTGHIIGCALMFLAGYIGGKTRKSAMGTAARSFGTRGTLLFSILNIVQLMGWTAIMIYDGSLAANSVFGIGRWIWCAMIGALIIVWILIGLTRLGVLNTISMILLGILTVILGSVVFGGGQSAAAAADMTEMISFGAAVELSAAMPLSWLPLISDYTREAEKPAAASAVSALVYGVVSCGMYIIGMGAAIFTGSPDIAGIMLKAGLGTAALLIIVISTVTTTFPDAYSAGVTSETISDKINGKIVSVCAAALGTVCAVFFAMDDITGFLYLVGSVFAPMIAVMTADFYILRKNSEHKKFDIVNLVIWAVGFAAYRVLMRFDIIIGNTLPDMLLTAALCCVVHAVRKAFARKSSA